VFAERPGEAAEGVVTQRLPLCPFCRVPDAVVIDQRPEVWPDAQFYRCSTCDTAWGLMSAFHDVTSP